MGKKYWIVADRSNCDKESSSEELARIEAAALAESNPNQTYMVAQVVSECTSLSVQWTELE